MIVSPKTEEEKQILINKGFIPPDNKSKWKFKININPVIQEYYLANKNTDIFRHSFATLLLSNYNNINVYCSRNYDGELIKKIVIIIDALHALKPNPTIAEIDKILHEFYDICDNHNIWIESD